MEIVTPKLAAPRILLPSRRRPDLDVQSLLNA
jgi:hypothetical protein